MYKFYIVIIKLSEHFCRIFKFMELKYQEDLNDINRCQFDSSGINQSISCRDCYSLGIKIS